MAITRARKAAEVGKGAAVGGTTVAVVVKAADVAMAGLTRAAPAAAKVVSRAVPAVAVGASVVGAGLAAKRSIDRGEGTKDVLKHAALGAFGLDNGKAPEPAAPKFTSALDNDPGAAPKWDAPMMLGGPKPGEGKTIAERQKELADRPGAGGDPDVYKNIARNSRDQMAKAKTQKERNAQERRALLAEEKYEQLTGIHIGPTLPDFPKPEPPKEPAKAEGFGSRMLRKAEDAIDNALFGKDKKSKDDALSTQRQSVEKEVGAIRKEMEDEAKSGRGQKYRDLQTRLDSKQKELEGLTKEQDSKEKEALAAYRQIGAIGVGAFIGGVMGRMTQKAAAKGVATAEAGIEKLGAKVTQITKKAPKGVIAGTVEGDKAAAAVAAAKTAQSKSHVSKAEAYAIPALNVAHGAAGYTYASTHPDDPASPALRMEGAGAIAAGVVGAKFGVAARAMRAVASPKAAASLKAAEKRIVREARTGPAGVAQAAGRRKVANAEAQAGVAEARGNTRVAVAKVRGRQEVDATRRNGYVTKDGRSVQGTPAEQAAWRRRRKSSAKPHKPSNGTPSLRVVK